MNKTKKKEKTKIDPKLQALDRINKAIKASEENVKIRLNEFEQAKKALIDLLRKRLEQVTGFTEGQTVLDEKGTKWVLEHAPYTNYSTVYEATHSVWKGRRITKSGEISKVANSMIFIDKCKLV